MALKDKWVDKINEVDNVDANDINTVANAVIEIEKTLENNGESGEGGENGATFTPSVSTDGTLSWTNDKGLDNPPSVNIKGADGEKGDKGDKGEKGENGKDGANGTNGTNGTNGVSATHSWNGTTLTITSASGTSSANLKGDKGDKGDTGAKGADGKDGEDYIITATDKQEIKNDILSSIITQEAGESESLVMSQKAVTDLVAEAVGSGGGGGSTEYETVDSVEEMTDTSKQYVLSTDGYIYTYTEKTEIVEHEAPNKFVASEAQINKRMGTSSLSVQNGFVWTGAIAVDLTKETPFRVKVEGTKITTDTSTYQKIWLCADNTGTTKLSAAVIVLGQEASGNYTTLLEDGTIYADYKANAKLSNDIITATKYIRIGFKFSDTAISSTSELSGVKITIPSEAYTEEVTTSAWVSTGMKPESAGGGNYVTLLTKINKNTSDISEIDNRVKALETGSETLTIPSFWQSAVDACISKIKALQIGRNCVTFPFFSDNHQRNGYTGMLIAYIMKECNIPYAFFGGDSIDSGYIASEAVMIAQDKAFDTAMSYIPNGRFCRAVGNHDGFWNDGTNKYYYNRDQVYDLFLREESIAQNKHFGEDGTYYYVDDIASKVRFIVMNTNGGSVDNTQIAWVQNTALSFNESGWAVVFISHQPICNAYHSGITNAGAVISAVTSKANTNNIPIIGWFSGHVHRDRIYTKLLTGGNGSNAGTATTDLGFTQVIITSDHTNIAYENDDGTASDTKHPIANDDQSHAIDFVTINKATRTVNLTRLGIGSDRSYTY